MQSNANLYPHSTPLLLLLLSTQRASAQRLPSLPNTFHNFLLPISLPKNLHTTWPILSSDRQFIVIKRKYKCFSPLLVNVQRKQAIGWIYTRQCSIGWGIYILHNILLDEIVCHSSAVSYWLSYGFSWAVPGSMWLIHIMHWTSFGFCALFRAIGTNRNQNLLLDDNK